MLKVILLDVLWEVVHLHTAGHGTEGKNGCTISYSTLAIKCSLSIQKKDSNLRKLICLNELIYSG